MRSILVVAVATLLAANSYADPVPVDLTKPVLEADGKPARDSVGRTEADWKVDPHCDKCPVLTFGRAIAHALDAPFPDDRDLPWEQKWARSVLADKLRDNPKTTLNSQEVALIERLLGKFWNGRLIGQVVSVIDPNHEIPKVQ